jgi:hypothetical protein
MKENKNDAVKNAEKDGCKPIWCNGILGWMWHCTCSDNRHGCDEQCSAIVKATGFEVERRAN